MEGKISLAFDENDLYQIEFSPPGFWMDFARSYNALAWKEISEDRVLVVAESYTYLLDMLVQARQYYIRARRTEEQNQVKRS